METISSEALRSALSATLSRVQHAGARVVILRHGKPTAMLVPVQPSDLDRPPPHNRVLEEMTGESG